MMVWDDKKIGQSCIQIDYDKIKKKHKVFGFWAAYLDSYGYTNWKVSDRDQTSEQLTWLPEACMSKLVCIT